MRHRLLLTSLLVFSLSALAGQLQEGQEAYEAGNFSRAVELLGPLAKQNDPKAQFRLGMMYYHGQGVVEDEKIAVDWLKKSAAQGHIEAKFELGNAFLLGHQALKLTSEPDREAAIWYHEAAQAGHASAQYHLGLLFLAGNGVLQNREEAMAWFNKAAAQGHEEAKRSLGQVEKSK